MNNWLLPIIILVLPSCTANYMIETRTGGVALVNSDRNLYIDNDMDRYYQSDIITAIDTTIIGGRVQYEIHSLDSIGNYLPFPGPDFFRMQLNGDTISLSFGHKTAIKSNFGPIGAIILTINPDRNVLTVVPNDSHIREKKRNTVRFHWTRKYLMKGKIAVYSIILD